MSWHCVRKQIVRNDARLENSLDLDNLVVLSAHRTYDGVFHPAREHAVEEKGENAKFWLQELASA